MTTTTTQNLKTLVSFKIDKQLKKEANKVCDEIGIPFSTFLNIQIKNLVRTKRFVGEVNYTPNETTAKAITLGEKAFKAGKLKTVSKDAFIKHLHTK